MRSLVAVPTWLLMRLVVWMVGPKHAWYAERISLREWAESRSEFAVEVDVCIWLSILVPAVVVTARALSRWLA